MRCRRAWATGNGGDSGKTKSGKIPFITPSLGGAESLVNQPSIMSYYSLTVEERRAVGIQDNLVRYAVGIEDPRDLIADLAQAFAVFEPQKITLAV